MHPDEFMTQFKEEVTKLSYEIGVGQHQNS